MEWWHPLEVYTWKQIPKLILDFLHSLDLLCYLSACCLLHRVLSKILYLLPRWLSNLLNKLIVQGQD
jgi:hypothetical protein